MGGQQGIPVLASTLHLERAAQRQSELRWHRAGTGRVAVSNARNCKLCKHGAMQSRPAPSCMGTRCTTANIVGGIVSCMSHGCLDNKEAPEGHTATCATTQHLHV
jgi:hypothetical protein